MTPQEFKERHVTNGWMIHPDAPLYLDEMLEAERLSWIKWRNRLYKAFSHLRLNKNGDVVRCNQVMEFFWKFPRGDIYPRRKSA